MFPLQTSKKSSEQLFGRNDANTKVIIPANIELPINYAATITPTNSNEPIQKRSVQRGDFIAVQITDASSVTLHGTPLHHSTIAEFDRYKHSY